jgi:hypothetical protein
MDSRGFRVIEVGNNGRSSQFETLCDNGSKVKSNLSCYIDRKTGSKRNSIATMIDAGCSKKEKIWRTFSPARPLGLILALEASAGTKISDPPEFASVIGSQIF